MTTEKNRAATNDGLQFSVTNKPEEHVLEGLMNELLQEEKEWEVYRLFSSIALAGLWLAIVLVALDFVPL